MTREHLATSTQRLTLIILIITALIACGGGGGGDAGNNDGTTTTTYVEATIGAAGGVVEVTDTSSPIYGAKIVIPNGTLEEDTVFSIEEISLPYNLETDSQLAGPLIDFGPEGIEFANEVRITLPYFDNDNDGKIDGTDISEDKICVITYDENLSRWLYESVYSVDLINNTVTISTNHFSIKTPSIVLPSPGRNDVDIFTIDGLSFSKILWPPGHDTDMRPAYLKPAIVYGMEELNLSNDNVYSYGGGPGESWSGDANYTDEELPTLISVLNSQYNKAVSNNKIFIMITHSWGTVLGDLALSFCPEVKPDLLITLSTPMGSDYVIENQDEIYYTNPSTGISVTVKTVQDSIRTYTTIMKAKAITKLDDDGYVWFPNGFFLEDNKRWVNYWAMDDIISGPMVEFHDFIEDNKIGIENFRTADSTKVYHALTSLDARGIDYFIYKNDGNQIMGSWKEFFNDDPEILTLARDFRNKIKNQICQTLNIGDACETVAVAVDDYVWFGSDQITKTDLSINSVIPHHSTGGQNSVAVDNTHVWVLEDEVFNGEYTGESIVYKISKVDYSYDTLRPFEKSYGLAVDDEKVYVTNGEYVHSLAKDYNPSNINWGYVPNNQRPYYMVCDQKYLWSISRNANLTYRHQVVRHNKSTGTNEWVNFDTWPKSLSVDQSHAWVGLPNEKKIAKIDKESLAVELIGINNLDYGPLSVTTDQQYIWYVGTANSVNYIVRVRKSDYDTKLFESPNVEQIYSLDNEYLWVNKSLVLPCRVSKSDMSIYCLASWTHNDVLGDLTGYNYDLFFNNTDGVGF